MNFYEDTSYLSFGSHFYTCISLIRDCYIYKHFQKYTQRLTQIIVTWGRQQKSSLSSYISKLWQASILIILYFTFKRCGRYGHDLDHVERIDWILLGVKQGYLNLYFTIIGNIAGSCSVDQAVFKLRDSPGSASWELGSKTSAAMHSWEYPYLCDHVVVCSVVIKIHREQNTLCCTWKS